MSRSRLWSDEDLRKAVQSKYSYRAVINELGLIPAGGNYIQVKARIKIPKKCQLCDWAKYSIDGRLPLEPDHINGDRYDNRIINLRILCPNCHSLQPTHRGKNKGTY